MTIREYACRAFEAYWSDQRQLGPLAGDELQKLAEDAFLAGAEMERLPERAPEPFATLPECQRAILAPAPASAP